jgi:hypothetical protein
MGKTLGDRLGDYNAWKAQLADSVEGVRRLEGGAGARGDATALQAALDALRADRLTVACVAEYARGKSELLNAIFFADCGRRLLPASAGRTTMCPTEIFHDPDAQGAYLRLLPIETRAEAWSLAELKARPERWMHVALGGADAETLAGAFAALTDTRKATLDEACALGFTPEGEELGDMEIPRWRHALISFPHPLLEQGLTLLDTPGLNALGAEPELTLSLLPAAQAVLFVLGADTGVTRSDLEIWQRHLRQFRARNGTGAAAVLNKIDTLWDELAEPGAVANSIETQRQAVARALDIGPARVFPVSAQKALIAKLRDDPALHHRSRIADLERFLGEDVLAERGALLHERVLTLILPELEQAARLIEVETGERRRERESLRALRGARAEEVMALLRTTREDQCRLRERGEQFAAGRSVFLERVGQLAEVLDPVRCDLLIQEARNALATRWTTFGLLRAMRAFFAAARDLFLEGLRLHDAARDSARSLYRRFHAEHGLPAAEPTPCPLPRLYALFDALCNEAEAFCTSPLAAMTEQIYLMRRFSDTLAAQAHALFNESAAAIAAWREQALTGLESQLAAQQGITEQRLVTLQALSGTRDTLESGISATEQRLTGLHARHNSLATLRARLMLPPPASSPEPVAAVG